MHLEVLNKKNQEIFHRLSEFKNYYLAGGTALALQIGHRKSVDFDLFYEKDIPKNLFSQVKQIFDDKKVIAAVNNPDELTVFIDNVKLSFIKYPFPKVLKLIDYKGLNLLSVKEIAATKAYTIGRRGSFKDYIDLYFILFESHTTLEEIIKLAEKKYGNEFNGRLFLEQLIYLDDIEDISIIFLKDKVSKKILTEFFKKKIMKLKLV